MYVCQRAGGRVGGCSCGWVGGELGRGVAGVAQHAGHTLGIRVLSVFPHRVPIVFPSCSPCVPLCSQRVWYVRFVSYARGVVCTEKRGVAVRDNGSSRKAGGWIDGWDKRKEKSGIHWR
jgi:hypothetical protein